MKRQGSEDRPGVNLFGVIALAGRARLAEAEADAEERIAVARRRVVEARNGLARAEMEARTSSAEREMEAKVRLARMELEARRDLLRLSADVAREEAEAGFWKTFASLPPDSRPALVERENATAQLLAERERIRSGCSCGSDNEPHEAQQQIPPPAAPALPAPMTPYISDADVERLATKAVVRLGVASNPQSDAAWDGWRQELRRRFPANVAAEIEARADEVREVADG